MSLKRRSQWCHDEGRKLWQLHLVYPAHMVVWTDWAGYGAKRSPLLLVRGSQKGGCG